MLCETEGEIVSDVALVVAHVRVEFCPEATLLGLALKVNVGAGWAGGWDEEDDPPLQPTKARIDSSDASNTQARIKLETRIATANSKM